MPIPPYLLAKYVGTPGAKSAPPVPAKTVPAKTPPMKAKANMPETPSQKAENATILGKILKANGIDPKTTATILSQFKAQDQ